VSRTIVLVEDNRDHVLLTLEALDLLADDVEVIVLPDGGAALDYLFAPETPAPALVLLDVKLPVADGFEVLRRIKADERLRVVPVVMLTSSSDERDVARSYELGSNSFVAKPTDAGELHRVVAEIPSYWLGVNIPPPPEKEVA
jgi:two-component system response regulator